MVTRRGGLAFGLAVALSAVTAVPGAGVSSAAVSTCGSLSLVEGAPVGGAELTGASYVSAGEL